jgi:cytochrome b561
MSSSSPAQRLSYGLSLRSLHWLIAAIILLAIALGVIAIELPRGPLRGDVLTLHKSLGVTAFVLLIPRLIVRWIEKAPAYVPPLGALTHAASSLVHLALYALMILLPLTGYLHSEAGNHGFYWFWLFPTPNFVAPDEALEHATGTAHYFLALLVGAALIAHIGAACWHAWVRKDSVLTRMWPGSRPGGA